MHSEKKQNRNCILVENKTSCLIGDCQNSTNLLISTIFLNTLQPFLSRIQYIKNPNLNFKSLLSLSLLSLLPREILCEEDAVVRGHIQPITLYVAYYKDYGIEWYSPTSCITRTNWISLCCL